MVKERRCVMLLIDHIKKIESVAYPAYMQQMQECETLDDLAEYCECKPSQVRIINGSDWYLIYAEYKKSIEVVDFASESGKCSEIFKVVSALKTKKLITMDAKEDSSYPLVMKLAERGILNIIHDEIWYLGNVSMHELKIKWVK